MECSNVPLILDFLRDLAANNNREWFLENKARYLVCQSAFVDLSVEFIRRLGEIDSKLIGLQAKDCIWRIYRDVRFSADKRPYKEWLGVFVADKGGRKSLHGGYYLHLQPGQCQFSAGIWSPPTELLKVLRKEIEANYDEIEAIMAHDMFRHYFTDFDADDMLKKVPAGFDPDFEHADWLKRKSFTITTAISDDLACNPKLLDSVMDMSRAAKPLNDFLNYTFEQYGEFPARGCR